ncbi:hypothetical protein K9B35_03970 [Sphingomonas sp. R647]|uniref:hypothetical protein n=1 Tax=Sphingomonas sp. R647 TaxID=2875233 RepID=UPI001CD5F051|nr:hypothetical protein [Sphingomonas sp. R647]MCA1197111.1 hypothetical protein [Sphingomonas sp. R647]
MRVLIEALHIAAGIAVALLIGALASWAYPLAQGDVWLVTGTAILCIIVMGIGPMRRALWLQRNPPGGEGGDDA